MVKPEPALTVYYDGQCIVCAREVAHYKRLDHAGRLLWVDISQPGAVPAGCDVSSEQLMAAMHARSAAGHWSVGVAAFVAIWQLLPGRFFPLLARVAEQRWCRPLLEFGYQVFARYRHHLPRYGRDCPDGSCTVNRPRKTKGG